MPFDAGVMAAVVHSLETEAVGARIEKVCQPERDEILLHLRSKNGSKKLLLSAAAGNSRVGFTASGRENPAVPPMFCMLLRKHLTGGFITGVRQLGFDRAMEISLVSSDELGFQSEKYLICEIMGTYSNVILLDSEKRISAVLHPVSLGADNKRQVLVGFRYENPDKQTGKVNALDVTEESFRARLEADLASGVTTAADKYLISRYAGLSPLTAREIVFRASKATGTPIHECDADALWFYYHTLYGAVREKSFSPCLVTDKNGKVLDFSFCEIRQYGASGVVKPFDSIHALLDTFYAERDRAESIKRRGQDVLRLLTNASQPIAKKTELQLASLEEGKQAESWKLYGDLITANIYALKKGMEKASLVNYFDEAMPTVEVKLDSRYTPAQNAQSYYKKYNKAKSARIMLTAQIEESKAESAYIDTVFESLTKAETESDLAEIRAELALAGYGKKLDNMRRAHGLGKDRAKLKKELKPMRFVTSDGYTVYCGKNNLQNDYVTTKLAEKNDYWFHVKNAAGSHVVMVCGADEPPAESFTECAMIALFYSSERDKPQAAVDYTRARYVKKPSGSKPGFVIYEKNYTAYVTADKEKVESLCADKGKGRN